MSRSIGSHFQGPALVLALVWLFPTAPSHAYVDMAPTLSKVISDSGRIALVEVVDFSREKHVAILKEVRALKGELSSEPVRHEVASDRGTVPRQVLQWAEPGARGVLFVSGGVSLMCVGRGWYQVHASGAGLWRLGADRPDLPLAYHGAVWRLADGVERMLAGKDAVLTVVSYGADDAETSFDLALNRANLPGLVKVQRVRANLRMPPIVMAASSGGAYQVGSGPVGEEDLPALLAKLKSSDALVRAEAADDLGWLGRKARTATGPLGELLSDTVPRVRLSAASALLRIDPNAARAVEVLTRGLEAGEPGVRRDAARAAGLAGPAAGPLTDKVAELLKEADSSTRITALQAIAMLGPAAGKAAGAVTALLDQPDLAIDAADALGRMGPAARPALKRLEGMLSADQPDLRWAAVRAMSQIGGEDARPAVDFMVRALPKASEVEGYNMMIYLALLGPVASDAAPAIRSARIRNPVLPSATLWAIQPDQGFPWLSGGRFGPGGFGAEGPDFARYIYEAYVHELGDRLRPDARALAKKIMDGTAGDVPAWGYKILACAPDEVIGVLSPHLAHDDLVMRERAAVALGYMGPAAAPARNRIEAALAKAPSQREQRLIKWTLREIGRG